MLNFHDMALSGRLGARIQRALRGQPTRAECERITAEFAANARAGTRRRPSAAVVPPVSAERRLDRLNRMRHVAWFVAAGHGPTEAIRRGRIRAMRDQVELIALSWR